MDTSQRGLRRLSLGGAGQCRCCKNCNAKNDVSHAVPPRRSDHWIVTGLRGDLKGQRRVIALIAAPSHHAGFAPGTAVGLRQGMIPKSVKRFSEKIMPNQEKKRRL
jgi:hypothetical protein